MFSPFRVFCVLSLFFFSRSLFIFVTVVHFVHYYVLPISLSSLSSFHNLSLIFVLPTMIFFYSSSLVSFPFPYVPFFSASSYFSPVVYFLPSLYFTHLLYVILTLVSGFLFLPFSFYPFRVPYHYLCALLYQPLHV